MDEIESLKASKDKSLFGAGRITFLLVFNKFMDSNLGPKILSFIGLILLWAFVASFFPPNFLPGPIRIAGKIQHIVLQENFPFHMYHTLFRTVSGFVLALLVAAILGVGMGVNRRIESLFEAEVVIGLTIPGLMWAVLALMWFGPHEQAAVFAVFIITLPVLTMNLWKGTKAIDRELVEMARAFKANKLTIVRDIIIPQVLPYIFSATRYGFAYAWKVVVLSEMFGLSNGVGFQINNSFNTF